MSRIGRKPVSIPDKVKVSINGLDVKVEGPKGKLSYQLPESIQAKVEGKSILFSITTPSRQASALHGLARSLVNNMVLGANEGFTKKLEIQGVGFKAALQGKTLVLNLGFSHPINYPVPDDIKVTVVDPTNLTIEGADKQKVGAVAADIRRYYPPEPYKGKGVRYAGETIIRKQGKTAQSK